MNSIIVAGKDIFVKLRYILNKKQKKSCLLVFFGMIVGSGLELLGVSAIYPFLQMMLSPSELQEKWYIKWIYFFCSDITTREMLLILGFTIIAVYILKNFFLLILAYIQNAFAARIERELSTLMLRAFLQRPYQFFLNTNSGAIIRGIGGDVGGVYSIILNIFTILSEALTIFLLGLFLFVTDPTMAIGALSLAAVCLIMVVLSFKGKMKRAGNAARIAIAKKNQYAVQAVSGIKEIIVSDRIDNFVKKYENAAVLNEKATLTNTFISACPDRIIEGICISGFIGIVCLKIVLGTNLSSFIPVLGTFAMAAFKILPSFSKISTRINGLVFYKQHLDETYNNIKAAHTYEQDVKKYAEKNFMKQFDDDRIINFSNRIEIHDVEWRYLDSTENVLKNISITIEKGQSVGLIGPSGSGKTTLADVIMGVLRPEKGSVTVDGIDIFTIPHQWAKIIGYVPQSVFLIDDTIRNNVAFGIDENEILDEKVWKALEQAQLVDFVSKLPNKLDTIVGERGIKFSGGQRQRIAIARALYENPDILVLDEATSALDYETETAVMDAIETLQGNKTLIIVAHRLTTVRNCDKIYEIKDGVATLKNKAEIFG